MFDNIDEEYRVSLISCIECLKKYHGQHLSSGVLILSFIHFEDSLFNELEYDLSFDKVFDYIVNKKTIKDDLMLVIEEAEVIAKNCGSKIIFDEYVLYACLKIDCEAKDIFEMMGINIEKLRIDIIGYINSDNNFLTNLTKLAGEGKLNPFIGRDNYIEKIIRILFKKQKNNCLLIGSAGVGKSALVEGLALELYNRKSEIIIYRLDLGVIIAGTRYRGDLEERLIEVLDIVKEASAVLFIDEIHTIISSGSSEGSLDIANILKPALARSEIKCIGATTTEEYYKYIEKDKALERRFEKIFIPEANKEETYSILKGIAYKYSEFYNIEYKNKILHEIIDSCKYFPNRKFPDKAIDIMDEVGSYVKSKKQSYIKSSDIRQIVFENMGVICNKLSDIKLNYKVLRKYYEMFFLGIDAKETICNVIIKEESLEYLLEDLERVFLLSKDSFFYGDFYCQHFYEQINTHVLHNPVSIIILKYDKNSVYEFVNEYINGNRNRKISFKNCVIIFVFEGKNKQFCEKIGYCNGDSIMSINGKHIDEVLTDNLLKRKKIEELSESMKKNGIILDIQSDIEDNDYPEIIKIVLDNLQKKVIKIVKNEKGELLFK